MLPGYTMLPWVAGLPNDASGKEILTFREKGPKQNYFCFLAALFLRRILFFLHFHRMFPRFFHARELRFIG